MSPTPNAPLRLEPPFFVESVIADHGLEASGLSAAQFADDAVAAHVTAALRASLELMLNAADR